MIRSVELRLLMVSWSLVLLSCEESLPTKEDISHQVTASLSSGYVVQDNRSYLRLYLTVKNNLDETLDGYSGIKGTMQVTWMPKAQDDGNFNKTRTFKIDASNIFKGLSFMGTGGKLTIPAKDSIVFYVNWDLKSDDSTFLMNRMPGKIDGHCSIRQMDGYPGYRRISEPQKFLFTASIKLYDQLSIIFMEPVTTTRCLVGPYLGIDPKCSDLNFIDPCSVVGQ